MTFSSGRYLICIILFKSPMVLGLYLPLKYLIKLRVQENLYNIIYKDTIGNYSWGT